MDELPRVVRLGTLIGSGHTYDQVAANLRATRWQRHGRAIVRHNGVLARMDRHHAVLLNAGARGLFTAFTACEMSGLTGWEREETHVLVPGGANLRRTGHPVRVHYVGDWSRVERHPLKPMQRLEPALIVAAGTFASPRPACGILAAAVQQRLTTPERIRAALDKAPRVRHRRLLALALDDITMGARALSEIDFTRLCRRHRLPVPTLQAVRTEPSGQRRYLDAEWRLADGRVVVVEVDGAPHDREEQRSADMLRQNELVIGGDEVLRYTSVLVRTEEAIVADQLRRMLYGGSDLGTPVGS